MKRGRPPKYKPEYVEQAEKLCTQFGADDAKLAEFFGVDVASISRWKVAYPEFREIVKKGKDAYDSQHVEKSLLQRALGYYYEEKTYERIELKPPEDVMLEGEKNPPPIVGTKVKTVIKSVAPDVTAQIFYLKNRQPARWRDKQDIDLTFKKPLVVIEEVTNSPSSET